MAKLVVAARLATSRLRGGMATPAELLLRSLDCAALAELVSLCAVFDTLHHLGVSVEVAEMDGEAVPVSCRLWHWAWRLGRPGESGTCSVRSPALQCPCPTQTSGGHRHHD